MRSFDDVAGIRRDRAKDDAAKEAIIEALYKVDGRTDYTFAGHELLAPKLTAGRDQAVEKGYRLVAAGVLQNTR